jgi:hypothetical protein
MLGKLIYDKDQAPQTVYVWRLHKYSPRMKEYIGPYRIEGGPTLLENIQNQPVPVHDFPPEDLNTAAFRSKDAKFGFLFKEDAIKWFGKDAMHELSLLGFTLDKIPASKIWLSNSQRQVIYLPDYRDPIAQQFGPPFAAQERHIESRLGKEGPLQNTIALYSYGVTKAQISLGKPISPPPGFENGFLVHSEYMDEDGTNIDYLSELLQAAMIVIRGFGRNSLLFIKEIGTEYESSWLAAGAEIQTVNNRRYFVLQRR